MEPTEFVVPRWRRRSEWCLLMAFPLVVLVAMAIPSGTRASLIEVIGITAGDLLFILLLALGTWAGLWSNHLYVSVWATPALALVPLGGFGLGIAFC